MIPGIFYNIAPTMSLPKKPHKLVQVKVTVGQDVDLQKLIGQVHNYVAKSKMGDRIEIHVNGEHQPTQKAAEVEDAGLALL